MTNSSKYNRDYYAANKKRIQKARRDKYRKNKAYREDAIKRARVQTAIKRAKRLATPAKVKHAGRFEDVLTFSEFSTAVDRKKDTIYRWRKRGIIPEATYRDKRGNGVYAMSQANYLAYLLKAADDGTPLTYPQLSLAIHHVWNKRFTFEQLKRIIKTVTKER